MILRGDNFRLNSSRKRRGLSLWLPPWSGTGRGVGLLLCDNHALTQVPDGGEIKQITHLVVRKNSEVPPGKPSGSGLRQRVEPNSVALQEVLQRSQVQSGDIPEEEHNLLLTSRDVLQRSSCEKSPDMRGLPENFRARDRLPCG